MNEHQEPNSRGGEPKSSQASELKEELGQKAHQAAEQARSVAEQGKQKLTEGAEGVTAALRHASEGLRSDEQEELARYTSVVADKLEQLTGMLKSRDLDAMLSDVTRFAKRQPALFLGGAFTTGLVAARFFKSSSSQGASGKSHTGSERGQSSGSSGPAGNASSAEQKGDAR
jgi:hypothetical protein